MSRDESLLEGEPAEVVRRRDFATDMDTLKREVIVEPYRSPGPGGQRKNRKQTAVRLIHPPSGITVIASERRSQALNREIAFQRLVKKLVELNRPWKRRLATKPSAGALRAQRECKEKLSQKKASRSKREVLRDAD